jgi:transcriptional regulator GlxA family with amidase domain
MDWRVELVTAVMHDNLHQRLSLERLARSAGLSQSRLHHLFKRETGVTPAHYFHLLKLERARELFGTTAISIKEVMSRVGIEDRSHFDREFKRTYGLTPAQYRMDAQTILTMKRASTRRAVGFAIK